MSSLESVREKRQFLRLPTEQTVELLDAEGRRSATSRDLGAGGLSLYPETSLGVGSLVSVQFELPSGDRVDAMCIVVRADGAVGLRFVHLEPHEVTAIHSFIVSNAYLQD